MELPLPIPQNPGSRRDVVYDSPPRRTPEDEQRDRAKQVESHPFLYYLTQFVPGLRPDDGSGGESPDVVGAVMAGSTAMNLGIWGERTANRLFEGSAAPALQPSTDAPEAMAPIVVAPQTPVTAPIQPVADPEALQPVTPAEFPRLVVAQVDRMTQNGLPAATLRVQLDPPHLGKVDLAVTYAQQKVTVNVVAATQQAKDQLEIQLAQIRGILHAHQLPTGEMKVMLASEAGSSGGQGQHAEQDPDRQPRRYRRRRSSTPIDEALAGI